MILGIDSLIMAKCYIIRNGFHVYQPVWILVDVPQGIVPTGTISLQGRRTWMAIYQRIKLGFFNGKVSLSTLC